MTPPRSLLVPADDEIEWDPIPPDDEIQWETPAAGPADDDGPSTLSALRDLFASLTPEKARQIGRSAQRFVQEPLKGSLKGVGSDVLGLGDVANKIAGKATGHETPPLGSTADALGLEPEGFLQKLGYYPEQLAAFFGPAAAKTPKLIAAGGKLGTLANMGLEGANAYGVASAQGGDGELAGILGAGGAFAAPVAKVLSPKVVAWLSSLASKGYGKAIGATANQAAKVLSKDVVPELLKRRLTAMTRGGLANKVGRNLSEAGAAVRSETAKVPMGTRVDLDKVVQQLESLKLTHMVSGRGGKMVPANAEAAATIEKIDSAIEHVRATSPQFHNVAKQKGILDNQVTQGGEKPFGRSIDDTSTLGVTKDVANMERAVLGAESVPLANANREFNLWANTAKMLEKEPGAEAAGGAGRAIAKALGRASAVGSAGYLAGGAKGAAAAGAAAGAYDAVKALVQSTGWRTVSAVNKARLADLIARQDAEGITRLVARLSSGTASQMSREKKKREYGPAGGGRMQEPTVQTREQAETLQDGQIFLWNGQRMKKRPGGADPVR